MKRDNMEEAPWTGPQYADYQNKAINETVKGNMIMAITADCHLHSSFSGDSDTPMEEMIRGGIAAGLTHMCFTEHNDFDFPPGPGGDETQFLLNPDSYLYDFLRLREKYEGRIKLLFGAEIGLQPHLHRENDSFSKSRDFDFLIGSSHVCNRKDPYYPAFYEGRSEQEAYREYFTSIIENIRKFTGFDVYGHLDYVVRYGPNRDRDYSYEKYRELFDEALILLIENGKGLEVNTGGVRKGLRELHPCTAVLRRYRELGGEIVTIGSDAHEPSRIREHFDRAAQVLKDCGFRYYAVFEKRKPEFFKI